MKTDSQKKFASSGLLSYMSPAGPIMVVVKESKRFSNLIGPNHLREQSAIMFFSKDRIQILHFYGVMQKPLVPFYQLNHLFVC